ncbi:uncharacterized protein LOC125076278 [Vanessa atalanta]|uniref:uncharacterized protein LOC125076278 n=1 Tax=Vanessa atalanta TaxID=42275 RepID=UPI001FCD8E5A|nr:uncharacterized protein LOC125076278 [Vanessa atalanta]
MDKDHSEEQLFPEDTQPPEQDEINECLNKLKKLFIAIDAIVKSIMVTPETGKETPENLELTLQTCKDSVMTRLVESVREYEDYIKSLKDADSKEPTEEDDFDQPD